MICKCSMIVCTTIRIQRVIIFSHSLCPSLLTISKTLRLPDNIAVSGEMVKLNFDLDLRLTGCHLSGIRQWCTGYFLIHWRHFQGQVQFDIFKSIW